MVYLGGLIFHARPFKSFQEGMFRYCVGWDGSAYILAFLTFNKGSIVFLMSLYLEQARSQMPVTHLCHCVFNGALYEARSQVPAGLSSSHYGTSGSMVSF